MCETFTADASKARHVLHFLVQQKMGLFAEFMYTPKQLFYTAGWLACFRRGVSPCKWVVIAGYVVPRLLLLLHLRLLIYVENISLRPLYLLSAF